MKNLGVIAVLLTVEFFEAGVNTISKAAMKKGMNDFVFVMYSNAFAVIFLLPFCFIFYRKQAVPSLTWRIFGQLCILGFFRCSFCSHNFCVQLFVSARYLCLCANGLLDCIIRQGSLLSIILQILLCSVQMLRFFGIGYSSPSLASAMCDLIPALTFVLAIFCRMENLDCKADSTLAKSFGTIVSIAGALTITLCKGLPLINPHSPYKSLSPTGFIPSSQFNWILGALLLMAQSILLSLIYILQMVI